MLALVSALLFEASEEDDRQSRRQQQQQQQQAPPPGLTVPQLWAVLGGAARHCVKMVTAAVAVQRWAAGLGGWEGWGLFSSRLSIPLEVLASPVWAGVYNPPQHSSSS